MVVYRLVHATGKTQLGGVKDDFDRFWYQDPVTSLRVEIAPSQPTELGIRIEPAIAAMLESSDIFVKGRIQWTIGKEEKDKK